MIWICKAMKHCEILGYHSGEYEESFLLWPSCHKAMFLWTWGMKKQDLSYILFYINGNYWLRRLRLSSCSYAVAYRGGVGVLNTPPPPKFRKPSKIVPNSTRLWKLLKIAEFRTPTSQDVRKKGSKILKLPRFAIVLHQQWQINWLSS